jgi:[ribosomal protein S5]-alanine N-acetyltransferase
MTIDTAFKRFPSLNTDRLLLRQIQSGDAETLFAILSDDEAMQFYGREPHRSLDDTRELIKMIHADYANLKALRWGITLKDTGGEFSEGGVQPLGTLLG